MEIIHGILFAYPAFTGLIVALTVLALVLCAIRWLELRMRRQDDPPPIEGLHSAPDNLKKRARRAV
jgi:hypothetical protein